jgi:hypothetical protein
LPFDPAVAMCRATNGHLLTNKFFEQNLNESSEEEPHTNQEPPRENDVIIDLPSRCEIVEVINNKAAGLDSAELLKSGRPSLVNALNKMIQQVWIGETLPESCTDGVLCPVYKNLIAKIIAASAF